ncbi:hypothetical protein PENTCL1PPCAC_30448 [Pristionchus entomophagus]|uniref:TATA element modulatory factor 1 TATA binding domain-containing protein n=1 Tax=Pristionchus entomophagus TaxID=358040 RepID=A0AAV5UI40_9BILA|nr:hypothetical protein PENTCL1PPCAC_28300 [Pristionchus entomophagus]GMT08274.1 hypothetical protein PENTCL1PPCAC_30448 [Pristionchus entomophagus]
MSFSWANLNLAKEALKNAQKKIDAVLDIREENDDGHSSPEAEQESSFTDADQPTPIVSEQPSFSSVDPIDTRSEAATSECDHWSRELKHEGKKAEVIVDTEPNPIHDMAPHSSSALLNHSPNSSPDEAENEDHSRPSEHDSSEEKEVVVSLESADDVVFSNIPLDETTESHNGLSRRGSRHEDEMTVASSDIEVIRNVDAWSLASSAVRGPTNFGHGDGFVSAAASHSIDTLTGQLRHHEQRIDELTLINQKMQETNGQLQQRIVALNQTEKTLRKELAEKEAVRLEILEEGKKMSDYNGKQSREIRRLKAQVADVDKIKEDRRKFKDEKMLAEENIESLREEIEILKGKLQSAERNLQEERNEKSANEIASEHHKNQYEENSRRIGDLEKANEEQAELIERLTEAKEALEERLSSLSENELAGRLASERASHTAQIANEELFQLRQKNEQLRVQLSECNHKLEQAIDGRSQLAEAVARATAPLLVEIEDLKAALVDERNSSDDHDNVVRGLKSRLEETNRELNMMSESLNNSNERSSSEQTHLLHRISKLEGHQSNLVASHAAQLESENEDKRRLQEELRQERKKVDDLKDESEAIRAVAFNLESTQSALREQLNELRERSIEKSEEEYGQVPDLPSSSPIPSRSSQSGHHDSAAASQSPKFHPFGSTLTHGSNAVQSEFCSLLRNHEMNLKRISELERITRMGEEETERRERRLRELSAKYKELEYQYNSLLEMDGEKLEKIDELQNDILDLRQLMKDQLIAFAEAREER